MLIRFPDEIHHELERNVQVKLVGCFEKWKMQIAEMGKGPMWPLFCFCNGISLL
jgi:hypothetical protein